MSGMNRTQRSRLAVHMLERVGEPLFYPKADGNVVYRMPDNFVEPRYQPAVSNVQTTLGIQNPELDFNIEDRPLPNLEDIYRIPRDGPWSIFIPSHREAAFRLVDLLVNEQSFEGFMSLSAACRDRINRTMFVYALSSAILRRPDLNGTTLPHIWEVLPDHFINSSSISLAAREASIPASQRMPVIIERDFTATDLEPEHRLAYFREDLGINTHHWHWHLVYPLNAINRDRKGELFYYMHQQMVARYEIERLCNGLPRLVRLHNWDEAIPEAYFPKLTNENAGFVWGSRSGNLRLQDVDRPDIDATFDLDDLKRWRDRIYEAIHRGFVERANGERVDLNNERGIDILGDLFEASEISVNRSLYGDLHNLGHVALAFIHDPDGRHRESVGVMGDTTTAMRDPVFYRWHKFVNDVFQEHKAMLPAYTQAQLGFQGVQVNNVEVITENRPQNVLITFWQMNELDLTRGLDLRPFQNNGPVLVRFTHLQHEPFTYRINVRNTGRTAVEGTVRIFLGPRENEAGQPLRLRDQRHLLVEMDKFQERINPGEQTITRRSDLSNVAIPFEQTFRQLLRDGPDVGTNPRDIPGMGLTAEDQYCGCGWPDHMLLPRGTPAGMRFDIFVMISDFRQDQVQLRNNARPGECQGGISFCGLRDDLYPDRRPMGFPFDRNPLDSVNMLSDFLLPNMRTTEVTIQHENRTIFRRVQPPRAQ